jgi:hypothetical protein
MMKTLSYMLAFSLAVLVARHAVWAQAGTDQKRAELAKALREAQVSLGAGLTASARVGKPISAKFELEDAESVEKSQTIAGISGSVLGNRQLSHKLGELQLTVYAERGGGRFSEVTVDPKSGKVVRFWPIPEGKDLTAAKRQSAALAKAKVSLSTAVDKAVADTGYTAVSVIPTLKNTHPVVTITLVKGDKWKTVTEKLD